MSKLKIVGIFNDDEENYFKIKVEKNEIIIKTLIKILSELNISHHLDAEPEILSAKYKEWVGRHEYFRTKEYILHLLFERDHLHIIAKCDLKNRKKFIKTLKKYADF